jgi:hypothetical protein
MGIRESDSAFFIVYFLTDCFILISIFHIVFWRELWQLVNGRLNMMNTETTFARQDEFYYCGRNEEDMKGHSSGVAGLFGARDE